MTSFLADSSGGQDSPRTRLETGEKFLGGVASIGLKRRRVFSWHAYGVYFTTERVLIVKLRGGWVPSFAFAVALTVALALWVWVYVSGVYLTPWPILPTITLILSPQVIVWLANRMIRNRFERETFTSVAELERHANKESEIRRDDLHQVELKAHGWNSRLLFKLRNGRTEKFVLSAEDPRIHAKTADLWGLLDKFCGRPWS